jgi:hypothetical protein
MEFAPVRVFFKTPQNTYNIIFVEADQQKTFIIKRWRKNLRTMLINGKIICPRNFFIDLNKILDSNLGEDNGKSTYGSIELRARTQGPNSG